MLYTGILQTGASPVLTIRCVATGQLMTPVDSERHGMYVGLDTRCYFTYQTGATLEKKLQLSYCVCVCSYRVRGVEVSCARKLTIEFYTVVMLCQHLLRYDTRCYFNVCSKADISQLNLPHSITP